MPQLATSTWSMSLIKNDEAAPEQDPTQPTKPKLIYTGDLRYSALNPLDVIKDLNQGDAEDQDWIIVRHFKNRFDLAAKYPELEDKILSAESKDSAVLAFDFTVKMGLDTDLVPVYEFYHRSSDSIREGRQVVFIAPDVVLYDGPLPYRNIPVYRISGRDLIGTPHGYSPGFDLLSLQEALDALYSVVVTNQTTFGVQNIMVPKGHDIAYSQLSGGLNLIEYDNQVGKPEALQLTATPPEVFNFINKLEQTMETLSGINSVARGNPEASLRSGSALALIQSMAIQFNTGLQQSYAQLMEDIGTATIQTLQDFAALPRIAMITGKNNRSLLQEFKGSDLDRINRVVVDVGNPLSKTTAGKIEIADNLLQQGLIKSPQEYLTLIRTGNFESLMEGQFSELMLIKSENDNLSKGDEVQAIATDNHSLHIQEHKSVLASPEIRKNPEVVKAALNHIQEHIELLRQTDPALLMLIGEQPLPPAQPPQDPNAPQGAPAGPQGAPQGPQGPQAPQQGGASPALQVKGKGGNLQQVLDNSNPIANKLPGMPSMPKNPLTGKKVGPQG
jgi:hypothetical protein